MLISSPGRAITRLIRSRSVEPVSSWAESLGRAIYGSRWGWLLYVGPGLVIVWVAHWDNIQRLRAGTERRFDPTDRQPTPPPGSETAPRGDDAET